MPDPDIFNPEDPQQVDFSSLATASKLPAPTPFAIPQPHNAFQTWSPDLEMGFGAKVGDAALGILRGPYNAFRDAYSLVDHIGFDFLPDMQRWEANSTAGAVSSDIFQILAGFATGSAILRGVGIAGKLGELGVLGKVGNLALENAATSLFFENHHNLSNLLHDNDLGGPVTDWLSIKKDDPEVMARLKNAIEGIGLTPVMSPIMHALGFVGKTGLMKVKEALPFFKQAGEAIEKELGASTGKILESQKGMLPEQAAKVLKGVGFEVDEQLGLPLVGEIKGRGQLDPTFKETYPVTRKPFSPELSTDSQFDFHSKQEDFAQDLPAKPGIIGHKFSDQELPIGATLGRNDLDASLPKVGPNWEITKVRAKVSSATLNLFEGGTAESAYATAQAFETMYHSAIQKTIKAGGNVDEHLKLAWSSIVKALNLSPARQATMMTRLSASAGGDIEKIYAKILAANDVFIKAKAEVDQAFARWKPTDVILGKDTGSDTLQNLFKLGNMLEMAAAYSEHAAGYVAPTEVNAVAKSIPVKVKVTPPEAIVPPEGTKVLDAGKPNKFGVKIPTIEAKKSKFKTGGPLEADGGPELTPEQKANTDFPFGANTSGTPPEITEMHAFPWIPGIGRKINDTVEKTAQWVAERGGAQKVADNLLFTKEMLTKHGEAGLAHLAERKPLFKRIWDAATEWQASSLLSNTLTQSINGLNNVIQSFWLPFEQLLGGSGLVALSKDEGIQAAKHAINTMRFTGQTYMDIFGLLGGKAGGATARNALWEELKQNKSTLFGRFEPSKLEYGPAIGASLVPWVSDNLPGVGKAMDLIGQAIRIPGSAMKGSDALFKVVLARSHAMSSLMIEAEKAGIPAVKRTAWATEKYNAYLFKNDQFLNPDRIIDESLQNASERLPGNPSIEMLQGGDQKAMADYTTQFAAQNYSKEATGFDAMGAMNAAKVRAQEGTFTTPAGPIIGKYLGPIFNSMRPFIPMYKTAANIVKFGWERTGDIVSGTGEMFHKMWQGTASDFAKDVMVTGGPSSQKLYTRFAKDMLSQDPLQKAQAIGRAATGMGILWLGYTLAQNMFNTNSTFRITGKGPADAHVNAEWKNAQNQEYAFQIGKIGSKNIVNIPYNRLDAFGQTLSIIADYNQYAHFASEKEQKDLSGKMGALWAAISNNLANKTYLKTFVDVISAANATEPDNINQIERILGSLAASAVPNILGASVPLLDGPEGDTLKELRSWLDYVNAKTPWGNPSLMPRRDILGETMKRVPAWGENPFGRIMSMINPIGYTESGADEVRNEMVRLNHPWEKTAATYTENGFTVDLTKFKNGKGQTAADRWAEIPKEMGIYKAIQDTISTDRYKNFPQFTGDPNIKNQQVSAVAAQLSAYQSAAKYKMLSEFPEVQKALQSMQDKTKPAIEQWQKDYNK